MKTIPGIRKGQFRSRVGEIREKKEGGERAPHFVEGALVKQDIIIIVVVVRFESEKRQ